MSAVSSLISLSMTAQSAALLGENVRAASRSLDFSKTKRRSSGANLKDITRLGLTNIVGIGLLRTQGQLAEGL